MVVVMVAILFARMIPCHKFVDQGAPFLDTHLILPAHTLSLSAIKSP